MGGCEAGGGEAWVRAGQLERLNGAHGQLPGGTGSGRIPSAIPWWNAESLQKVSQHLLPWNLRKSVRPFPCIPGSSLLSFLPESQTEDKNLLMTHLLISPCTFPTRENVPS